MPFAVPLLLVHHFADQLRVADGGTGKASCGPDKKLKQAIRLKPTLSLIAHNIEPLCTRGMGSYFSLQLLISTVFLSSRDAIKLASLNNSLEQPRTHWLWSMEIFIS